MPVYGGECRQVSQPGAAFRTFALRCRRPVNGAGAGCDRLPPGNFTSGPAADHGQVAPVALLLMVPPLKSMQNVATLALVPAGLFAVASPTAPLLWMLNV